MGKSNSDLATEVQLRTLLNGLQTKMAANVVLPVKGTTFTRDQLAQVVQAHLATFVGARQDRATASQSAHARNAARPGVRDFLAEVRSTLNTQFGAENPSLLDYGYQPKKKKRELTHEEKVAMAQKAAETRQRNHTMGRRQKEQLRDQASTTQKKPGP